MTHRAVLPISDFNPRTREGATPMTHRAVLPISDFNPRTREGATLHALLLQYHNEISIHAPVRVRQ